MPDGNLLIIGASTGGPRILEELVPCLGKLNAAVLIIQHVTPLIDQSIANSLARRALMPVSLARQGEYVQSGHVYIAPGGAHLVLVSNRQIRLSTAEAVNSVRPSVDVAMKSIGRPSGRLVGVILSGMGHDGADGVVHLKKMGGITLAQDRATSVIYGMPKAAVDTGCVDFVLPTERIADKLRELLK